jgi:4-aminobutyrate aminotransferase-like enzyme
MVERHSILAMSAFDAADAGVLEPVTRGLVARRLRVFGAGSPLFYHAPIHMQRAEGVWMYDAAGKNYLDCYNNVPSVGHCHPHVVAAIARQAATLNTHTRYIDEGVLNYAEQLLATFPAAFGKIAFTCTGSESSDLALRIARLATGGSGFVVTETAYHGNTQAVSEISPSYGVDVPLGLHVRTVKPPDPRAAGGDAGARFAADIEAAIADLRRHGVRFAGLMVDTVFSSDGVFAEPAGFLSTAADVVREAGGMFIADEVQPGFGRTGAAMWGFMRHGITPDLVVLGKPMGNGFPMGAVVARPEIFETFSRSQGYFNTFAGNPVAAAAGLAVLDVLRRDGLMENARQTGAYLRDGLDALAARREAIAEVRGVGLYVGVELRGGATFARAVVEGMRARQILIGTAGAQGNVLKLRPPLCFGPAHADLVLQALGGILETAAATCAEN